MSSRGVVVLDERAHLLVGVGEALVLRSSDVFFLEGREERLGVGIVARSPSAPHAENESG